MSNQTLLGMILVAVIAIGAFFAYQAYERDQNTLDIEISPDGVQVD